MYAACSGSRPEPSASAAHPTDYLIHEATYSDRHRATATEFGHSTSVQAAEVAKAVRARHLFLTHVGGLPGADEEIATECARVFRASTVAVDRQSFEL